MIGGDFCAESSGVDISSSSSEPTITKGRTEELRQVRSILDKKIVKLRPFVRGERVGALLQPLKTLPTTTCSSALEKETVEAAASAILDAILLLQELRLEIRAFLPFALEDWTAKFRNFYLPSVMALSGIWNMRQYLFLTIFSED